MTTNRNLQPNIRSVVLGGGTYALAVPYVLPPPRRLIGLDATLELIDAAFLATAGPPLNVLLVGPPGVGKTAIAEALARRRNQDLHVTQGHDGVTPDELAVAIRPASDNITRLEFELSSLSTAMVTGGLWLLDELPKLRCKTLAALASVGDHRRVISSTMAGFTIPAHPDFRLIATANASDFASASLPDWIAARFPVRIDVKPPSAADLNEIVRDRFVSAEADGDRFLDLFWACWRKNFHALPSPRRLLDTAQLAFNIVAKDHQPLENEHVTRAIHHVCTTTS